MKNYVVFDLETSGLNPKISEIIEIAALKIRDNKVVDTFCSFVKPNSPIDPSSSEINGITDEMVCNAPSISDILPYFIDFIENDCLVGHNISTFDLPIIRRITFIVTGGEIENDYIDTLQIARKRMPFLPNKRLCTIASYFSIDTSGSHRALTDCLITKKCYDCMLELPICESLTHNAPHKHKSRYSEQTKSLQTLHSFLLGVIADNILTESEIFALKKWLDDNSDLSGQYPFDKVFSVIEKALDDNMLDQNELDKMLSLFKKYTTPSENCTSLSPSIVIQNKLFCLTGDFIHGERKEIECLIESMGGICKNGVSGKVNYVIVGSNGSPDWSCGNYGNKIKRALELQEQGKDIQIVKEADFFAVLE